MTQDVIVDDPTATAEKQLPLLSRSESPVEQLKAAVDQLMTENIDLANRLRALEKQLKIIGTLNPTR